jgi:uncharacterized membrane protein
MEDTLSRKWADMAELTVWTFPTPDAATTVATRLCNLCTRNLIRLDDAALVSWPEQQLLPTLRPLTELPRSWKLDDAFWGLLSAMLFRRGQLPAWQDVSQGSLSEGLAALGIDADLLDILRARIVTGTSALLLMADAENARRIGMAIDGMSFTLFQAPLSTGQEQRLRSTFSTFAD